MQLMETSRQQCCKQINTMIFTFIKIILNYLLSVDWFLFFALSFTADAFGPRRVLLPLLLLDAFDAIDCFRALILFNQ